MTNLQIKKEDIKIEDCLSLYPTELVRGKEPLYPFSTTETVNDQETEEEVITESP